MGQPHPSRDSPESPGTVPGSTGSRRVATGWGGAISIAGTVTCCVSCCPLSPLEPFWAVKALTVWEGLLTWQVAAPARLTGPPCIAPYSYTTGWRTFWGWLKWMCFDNGAIDILYTAFYILQRLFYMAG